MGFAAFAAGVLTLVLNVNNNNNNNNNLNINAIDSSNIVANFNTNNANQVNIMPPGKRRKKRSVVLSSATTLLLLIRIVMNMEEEEKKEANCKLRQLCKRLKLSNQRIGSIDKVLWSIYTSGVELEKQSAICEMVINSCDMQ